MAKWEDKDPRWLVADRQDGQNVNSWHWEEKNRLAWSRVTLDNLLRGLAANIDASLGGAKITGVSNLSGEVGRLGMQTLIRRSEPPGDC